MHKCFYFERLRRFRADLRDFFKRELACQHDALCAHVIKRVCGLIIHNAGLRGNVYRDIRRVFFCHGHHAEVGHDERVYTDCLAKLEKRRQRGKFCVMRQNITGDIDLHALRVAVFYSFFKLLVCKIGRRRAHAEGLTGKIHRVRTVAHSRNKALHIADRRQKLRRVISFLFHEIHSFTAFVPFRTKFAGKAQVALLS